MDNIICMVAPNGARRQKEDHPEIPLTTDEMAATAKAVLNEGAVALHLHVRKEDGAHSINVERYRASVKAVKKSCGDNLFIQVTSESVGIYTVKQQIKMVKALKPNAVSLSVKELSRADENTLNEFDHWLKANQVLPQWIIYDMADLTLLRHWVKTNVLNGTRYPVLFVLGNYAQKLEATLDMLAPFIATDEAVSSWMVCAFGKTEQDVMKHVIKQGGHLRIGFENNLWRNDGTLVKNNEELVRSSIASIKQLSKTPASIKLCTQLLTPEW